MAARSNIFAILRGNERVYIRQMTQQDIPAGERLCRASGWNQLESDWRLFLECNPEGCRVAELDREVVGTVTSLPYEYRFTWLAMVLVDPSKRRKGIGTRLFEEGLALAGEETCIRLDATDVGRQIYREYGFVDEYPISRMIRARADMGSIEPCREARRMCSQDLPRILELDREIFGADRKPVLRALLARAPECAWLVAHSNIKGYCFGRDGFLYRHIGPIMAENERVARTLVTCCLGMGAGRPHVIDALEHSTVWLEWLAMIGFIKERSFTRMSRGNNKYPGDPKRVFAAAGPELG